MNKFFESIFILFCFSKGELIFKIAKGQNLRYILQIGVMQLYRYNKSL